MSEGDTIYFHAMKLVLPKKSRKFTFIYDCFNHPTNILEDALIFLNCMVNEHVFMNFVSLCQKDYPSLILRLGKSTCNSWISTAHIDWDYWCTVIVQFKQMCQEQGLVGWLLWYEFIFIASSNGTKFNDFIELELPTTKYILALLSTSCL